MRMICFCKSHLVTGSRSSKSNDSHILVKSILKCACLATSDQIGHMFLKLRFLAEMLMMLGAWSLMPRMWSSFGSMGTVAETWVEGNDQEGKDKSTLSMQLLLSSIELVEFV